MEKITMVELFKALGIDGFTVAFIEQRSPTEVYIQWMDGMNVTFNLSKPTQII